MRAIARDHIRQARLLDRRSAVIECGDNGRTRVDANHLVATICENRGKRRAKLS